MTLEEKFAIGLGITTVCNMVCSFCYSVKRRAETSDLPIEDWMNFFIKNKDFIRDINFGTGENPLVEDWFRLVEFIGNLNVGIGQALTTNGSLVSRIGGSNEKDRIIKSYLSDIDVSLDYSDEHRHNQFRGHKNAFGMANDTLAYCLERGFNTTIVIMGIDDTLQISNMEGIFDIAARYGALVRVNIYRPVNKENGLRSPSFDTLLTLFDWVSQYHQICSLSDPLFSSVLSDSGPQRDPSGTNSLRILPDGTVYPSTYLISPDFSLGHISDADILVRTRRSKIVSNLTAVIPKDCLECEVVKGCGGGTIDRRILWYGTLDKPDPYCPKNFGYEPSLRKYAVNAKGFSSIHHGYLPTIFFKPKLGVKT